MVIPVGPPGAQHVLKVMKKTNPDGSITAVRSDIYGGAIIRSCRSPAATGGGRAVAAGGGRFRDGFEPFQWVTAPKTVQERHVETEVPGGR